jgi:uncharacterized protein YkwD
LPDLNCQYLLQSLVVAGTHPEEYAAYIEKLKPCFKGKECKLPGRDAVETEEGWAAQDGIGYLRSIQPASPLVLSRGLCPAAQQHVNDQGPKGSTGHKGSDGSARLIDLIEEFSLKWSKFALS